MVSGPAGSYGPRTELRDVQPRQTGHTGYGLELRLYDAAPVELAGTALRFSVVDAQAAALRRWAGLPAEPPAGGVDRGWSA